MSGWTAGKIVIAVASIGGQLAWQCSPAYPASLIMQNKTVDIIITGNQAHVLGQALNMHLPNVHLGSKVVTAVVVIVISICGILMVTPLVQALNAALGRNYDIKVRWYKKGPGQQDDQLVFRLVP